LDTTLTAGRRPTAEEATALWRAWVKKGDSQARDQLVLLYSPMVNYLATKKARELPDHCELEDLVSCGLIALIEAVDRFDPVKGATFEQYAWTRVTGAIVDELRRQDWASRSVRRFGRKADRARDAFVAKNGVAPSEHELAKELQMDVSEVRDRIGDLDRADVVSLNAYARGTEDTVTVEVGDTIEAPQGDHDPELTLLLRERSSVVRRAIESLSDREKTILSLVYVQHLPGAEIGRMLGVSESRVSQILSGIRQELKEKIERYERVPAAV
jgi:RNA polymerase sigma factor for flagellar operon FliA